MLLEELSMAREERFTNMTYSIYIFPGLDECKEVHLAWFSNLSFKQKIK